MIRIAVVLTILTALAGCSPSDDHAHGHFETHSHELAIAGAWTPDPTAVGMAANYPIDYTGAGPWVGTSGCSGNFTQGGQRLKQWVLANWPQVSHIGGYACRPIVGNSSRMSVHGTGRAIDIHIPLDGGQADNGAGDPLANWLIEHADEIGIQMIIWDRWMWSPSREPRSRAYTGAHAHHDHLHVEITTEAANMMTPWFQGNAAAPQASDCEAVPAGGRVIDETDDCFVAFGPSQYWRLENGMGTNGSLLWTNAFQSGSPSNWARWNIDVESSGQYVVEYYNETSVARFDSVRYEVRAAGETQEVFLDQSNDSSGWHEIGTFSFDAGNNQWVSIFDNTQGSVPDGQSIVVDAIRVRPVGSTPGPSNQDTNPGGGDTTIPGDDSSSPSAPGNVSGEDGSSSTASHPGHYGTSGDDALPPKGSVTTPPVPENHDHDDYESIALGDLDELHAGGHACSTTQTAAPLRWTVPLFVLVLFGVRRRRI